MDAKVREIKEEDLIDRMKGKDYEIKIVIDPNSREAIGYVTYDKAKGKWIVVFIYNGSKKVMAHELAEMYITIIQRSKEKGINAEKVLERLKKNLMK